MSDKGKLEPFAAEIIDLYVNKYWSAGMIAEKVGASRQGVILALNTWGIDTSDGVRVLVRCLYCGKEVEVKRGKMRKKLKTGENTFCSRLHAAKWRSE